MRTNSILLLVGACAYSAPAQTSVTYSAVGNFALQSNPNGVWSYLYGNTPMTSTVVGALSGWFFTAALAPLFNEGVFQNITGQTLNFGTLVVPTDHLVMSTLVDKCVLRFTTPATGSYTINGDFLGFETTQTAHNVGVLVNGTSMFSGTIANYGDKAPFNFKAALNAGDQVDFVNFALSSASTNVQTGISATIQTIQSASVPVSVFVIPYQAWTDTGISVSAGEQVAITAKGQLNFYTGSTCGASCIVGPDGSDPGGACAGQTVPAPNLACNSLIGKIGANGTPFQVGSTLSLASAPISGELFLGVNDSNFADDTLGWTASVTASSSGPPLINLVSSASAFGDFSATSPGGWIEIYGSNLSSGTRGWGGNDFNGINAPTSLDGTSVSVGGKAAFVDYISPTQVNALLPSDLPAGTQLITISNSQGTSVAYGITINPTEPGLLAPTSFNIGGVRYAAALFADGTYVLPTGALAGVTSRPANPGEIVTLYGVGFGVVTPRSPAGQLVQQSNSLDAGFQVSIANIPAKVSYAGLAPNYTGLYQFNITVPNVGSGAQPLTFTLGGIAGTQTLSLSVGN